MHGVSFMIGVPCQLLAVLLLSLILGKQASQGSLLLLALTGVITKQPRYRYHSHVDHWSGNRPIPTDRRFLGWPNRLFMVGYGVWTDGRAVMAQ